MKSHFHTTLPEELVEWIRNEASASKMSISLFTEELISSAALIHRKHAHTQKSRRENAVLHAKLRPLLRYFERYSVNERLEKEIRAIVMEVYSVRDPRTVKSYIAFAESVGLIAPRTLQGGVTLYGINRNALQEKEIQEATV